MKISSVEPWIENIAETGCIEPAFKQKTNDDVFVVIIIFEERNSLSD